MDKKPDLSKISPELKAKMLEWEKNNPQNRQLQVMSDVADMLQELLFVSDESKKDSKDAVERLGALLTDAREQLVKLNEKELPESPDFSKPIVEVLEKLEQTMASKEYKPTIKVDAPKVDVPTPVANVSVSAPDLKGIEELLKTEVPKAFEKAISQIPAPEKADNSDILSKFDGMLEVLESIDDQVRKTPTPPTTVKVTNPDGTLVGAVQTLTERYDYDDPTTIYTAEALVGTSDGASGWTITKYDLTDSNDASGKVATDVSWTDRASGTYS